jgi:septal ring factor EnvC (AmiA/AmiB activator)
VYIEDKQILEDRMRDFLTGVVKKVTLEVIYEVVDERTEKILEIVNEIKKKQEDDFRYLNQKIDTQIGQVRQEMGQVRQEIGQLRQEVAQLNQKIDTQISQLNQRIDTVIQLLVDIKKS